MGPCAPKTRPFHRDLRRGKREVSKKIEPAAKKAFFPKDRSSRGEE